MPTVTFASLRRDLASWPGGTKATVSDAVAATGPFLHNYLERKGFWGRMRSDERMRVQMIQSISETYAEFECDASDALLTWDASESLSAVKWVRGIRDRDGELFVPCTGAADRHRQLVSQFRTMPDAWLVEALRQAELEGGSLRDLGDAIGHVRYLVARSRLRGPVRNNANGAPKEAN